MNEITNNRKNGDIQKHLSNYYKRLLGYLKPNETLRKEKEELNDKLNNLKKEKWNLETILSRKNEKLRCKNQEITKLRNQLKKLENTNRKKKTNHKYKNQKSKITKQGEKQIDRLKILLPQIEFKYQPIDDILNRVTNENMILRKLYQLNKDLTKLRSEKVENTIAWHEVHFGTGVDDSGRLYYRHLKDGKFCVYTGTKKTQKKDINQLKKYDGKA